MRAVILLAALGLLLQGCAWFAALPLASQLSVTAAATAAGTLALNAEHDCRADGGCKAVPLPP